MSNIYTRIVQDNFQDLKIVSGQFLKSFYLFYLRNKKKYFLISYIHFILKLTNFHFIQFNSTDKI